MWKDTTGKTGYKNMQGNKYLYGNLKLLNSEELGAALADGITEWIKTPPPPEAPWKKLERVKLAKIQSLKNLFETESLKPVNISGVEYKGGYNAVSRIDSARRLGVLSSTNPLTLYDKNDKPVLLNPKQLEDVVKGLGVNYQNLFAIRQELIVNIRESVDLQAVENIVIPWVIPEVAI